MSETRDNRMYYIQCCHCSNFILYETDSNAIVSQMGRCPVNGETNRFTKPWKVGYVSSSERDTQWTPDKPLKSPELAPVHSD